jgi:nicotinamidase-related amidase
MSRPSRLTARDGGLLVIDAQERLLAAMRFGPLVVAQAVRLVKAAQLLDVPVWATEQYPKGLGPTDPALAELLPDRPAKQTFHCCEVEAIVDGARARGVRHFTLAGIEAHVCVDQTALELLSRGFEVQVPADAVASRGKLDWQIALRRMEAAGAVVTTSEAVLFEWTETAAHPHFKAISALVKDFAPPPKPSKHKHRRPHHDHA